MSDLFIPFRPHPVSPDIGVLARFDNGVSVLLEADRSSYEVMDTDGDLHYFDTVTELVAFLTKKGCENEEKGGPLS